MDRPSTIICSYSKLSFIGRYQSARGAISLIMPQISHQGAILDLIMTWVPSLTCFFWQRGWAQCCQSCSTGLCLMKVEGCRWLQSAGGHLGSVCSGFQSRGIFRNAWAQMHSSTGHLLFTCLVILGRLPCKTHVLLGNGGSDKPFSLTSRSPSL